MDRLPARQPWNDRFPSPPSCWTRSPYGGPGHRGGSSRGYPTYSPTSPMCSPVGFNRGHWGSPQTGSGGRGRSFGGSPARFGSGERAHRRGHRFERPLNFSPSSSKDQDQSFDSIEKYFSPSMLEDPWAVLQPTEPQTSTSNNQ
ncbi:M-phase-specific PLK1-interacting protein [Entelurus aequoreus]|uniref:M-phase-specific PLK1-interacting protein n=1 Tax=Entelurus aequoreus TaxID=161455 RepID=UPI002B1D0AA5|nr:M-phase-specific PLK1-interacting protein [Entelurus aequoreus]